MDVNNKIIAVTGGGNGIGRELVLQLLKRGAKVAAADISSEGLSETTRLAGKDADNMSSHILDITDKVSVGVFPEEVVKIHGTVDGIINNAGIIQPFERVNDLGYDIIERVFNINFYGTLYMTKAFLPVLLERPEAHIVNVSSMGGFLPVPGQSIYCAAKGAVKMLTEGLDAELRNSCVKVSLVFPGAINTNIKANSGAAEKGSRETDEKNSPLKPLSPADASKRIILGMIKNRSRIFVGTDSNLMDKIYRFSPSMATGLINKQMKSHLPE